LAVLGFNDMTTADQVIPELEALQREGLIQLADWARVIRRTDGSIDTRQMTNTAGVGAAGGALWGLLFGLIFFIPVAGALIGAAMGAVMGKLADYGIDDKFIKDVSKQITPGTSALFLYVSEATTERVIDRLSRYQPTLIRTSLSKDAEEALRKAMEEASSATT
jgi:uncharacterized membrane protein